MFGRGLRVLRIEFEAFASLLRAWGKWRFWPFRSSIRSGAIQLRKAESAPAEKIESLMDAIDRVASRVPFRAVCYQKGLAAQYMLRRRGVDAILHYGVRSTPAALDAHVWITVCGKTVMGDVREKFTEVARYPEQVDHASM